MANNDDDILMGPVPDPDAEPTAGERAHARTFAELVDKTLSGRTPPAMSADDRALLEVATVIRAARGKLELPATTQRALVEDVLRQAVGATGAAHGTSNVTPIARSRRRWVPWAIAGTSTLVAVAAILLLWLRTPPKPDTVVLHEAPASWTSRPADGLIGPIPRERAADASARIDDIFADRLDGYRERRLERWKPHATTPNRGGKP